jgi:hypothetical protein
MPFPRSCVPSRSVAARAPGCRDSLPVGAARGALGTQPIILASTPSGPARFLSRSRAGPGTLTAPSPSRSRTP